MNLIKLIFIILFFQGLYGQAIPTPQTIKPAIILENTEDNALVTFIGFEEINGEYKIAKGYIITKNNNLLPRPDIFDFTLDPSGASFFSGAHYKDITGEGIPEAIFLVTNPQSGTYMRSWTLGPGYKTKTSVHKPYYIKTKQKASEAVSSLADIVYADKDYEIAICFGSPERKIVILDHQGEIRSKVIGKKFLENNVGPILLRTADFNNDGMFDLYILSNGAIKEETIYYAPDFKEGKRKSIETQEKIKDIYFISSAAGETKKIILLKNEKIYIEEWEKYFSTEEKETDKIIGHKEKTLFIMNRKGNIVEYLIEDEDKSITKTNKTESLFQKEGFNKLEYLFINEHQVLVSHNKEAEIAIQTIGTTELVPEARIKSKDPAKTNIGSLNNKENSGQAEKETKQQTQTETNETRRLSENNKIENITTSQDSLIINVGESKEIKISLDNTNQFLGLEKIEGPEEMILDKTKLAFIWTPTIKDVGPNVLKYRATHNISEEYEIYFENNIEKLRLKQDLQTTEYSLTLYVNARPTIKISPSDEYAVSANQELVVPIYINDSNVDQTLSININPSELQNSKIENRKFFWTPNNENYGENIIQFIVTDGILDNTAQIKVFVDTTKTEIKFDQKLITTVNKEFIYDLPCTIKAKVEAIESPENVRIATDGKIHWIPTTPQLGNNTIIVEIKEPDQTYFYHINIFVNAPPIISYRPDDIEYLNMGETFSFIMRSFEENEDQKHFWSIQEKPETMQLNNSEIIWVANEPDYHKYHIELSDTIDTDDFYGYIYVNDFPKITSAPPTYVALGDTLEYAVIVEDKNKQSAYDKNLKNELQYFLKSFPKNMSLNENIIIWSPQEEDIGQHLVEVEVYDGIEKTEQSFSLFVNDVPSITSNDNIKIAVGEEMHHFVKAQDSNDFTKLTYAINSNLDNMLMNTKTGEILWTPIETDLGMHTIEVSVSDGFNFSKDVQKINITVYKNPKFIDPTLPEAYAGVEYNHTIKAEDMYKKNISEIDVFVEMKEATFKEITFNKLNYNLQIIPSFDEIGTQYISLSLEDNHNNQIIENFPIKVLSSPCETSDTLYVDEEEVVNKLQKIDKSIIYTSKNEKLNILGKEKTNPDTIFITKYDTTITNITDSIFVTINNTENYIKENAKLTKRQKRRAERQAARQAGKTKQTAKKQKTEREEGLDSKEEENEPLVITTQHKNINIINKETVVVEQIVLDKKKEQTSEDLKQQEQQETESKEIDLGHEILGIKTPKEDKLKKHLFGKKSIPTEQKTDYVVPEFLNQEMYWYQEEN